MLLVLSGKAAFGLGKLDIERSIKILSGKNDPEGKLYDQVLNPLGKSDSATVFSFLDELERIGRFANAHFKARFTCLKVFFKIKYRRFKDKAEINLLNETALNYAYETGDDYLIALVSFQCGAHSLDLQEMELAATYLLKSHELYDGFDPPVKQTAVHWIILGEVLFHCGEYERSIFYTRAATLYYIDTSDYAVITRLNNTIGQGFDRLGNWDSAMVYYQKSMKMAEKAGLQVWVGINAGYIGELYFRRKEYSKAAPLLQYNYAVNKTGELDHAAKSLQALAAIDLTQDRKDNALKKIREALDLIKRSPSGYYLQPLLFLERTYFTTSDVYRALGNTDSFYLYNTLYTHLHDSLQKVSLLISTKIAKLRIDNDNNLRSIQLLQKEKQTAATKRNLILLSLLLATVVLVLYFNRLRLKQKHRQQVALQQKTAAEAELLAAKDQMQLITQNVVEKTELVEKLARQLSHMEKSTEHQDLISDITRQTILTEDEWENFKEVFEKIHPGFFIRLRERARDITVAEQRMAALTRLNLTSRQMASMLGISVDSVHKTRQRLRQRLQFSTEVNLEESLSSI